jgi:Cys-tRNA(Pro)/Cys-tRNA(Cys) deacylase
MAFTNNVTRMLDSKKVKYTVHTYDYGPEAHSAVEVAQAIGLPTAQVFKTLVTLSPPSTNKPMLVVIPGAETLDLKKLAKAIGVKKVQMAARAQAEEMTGLLAGGISPLALIQRGFNVYLDRKAVNYEQIYISAGERGAQIGLDPNALIKLTRARLIDLS